MDLDGYLRFILALVFVLALIGLLSWAARRYGLGGRLAPSTRGTRRLSVVEVTTLDTKHRLVLVRGNEIEHLAMIGGPNDIVIEGAPEPVAPPSRTENVS